MLMRLLVLFALLCSTASFASNSATQLNPADKSALVQLANVLENPSQRAELIKQLRAIANDNNSNATSNDSQATSTANTVPTNITTTLSDENSNTGGEAKSEGDTIAKVTETTKAAISEAVSLPRKLAESSAQLATKMADKVKRSWHGLANIFTGKDYRATMINWPYFWKSVRNLAIIIFSVFIIYQSLIFLTHPLRRRLNDWSLNSAWSHKLVRKLFAIMAIVLMDSVFLAITYVAGNALALYAVGQYGQLSTQTGLFMNAFVVIELLKIGLRIVFLARFPGLRLLTAANENTRFYYRWLARIINLLGYGFLVASPLIEAYISYALAQAVSTVIAISAFIYGVWVVISKRIAIRNALLRVSDYTPLMSIFVKILAYIWHLLALGYFFMLLVVTLLYSEKSLPYILKGTLKTLIIVGAGLLTSSLLTEFTSRRITLPEYWSRIVPSIERQLNAYIPLLLRVIRFILLITVILSVLSAWNLINLDAWIQSNAGQAFINRWLGAFLILLFSAIIWIVFCGIIEHRLSPDTGSGRPTARAETVLSLIKNAVAILMISVCLMMVLSQIGINIGPLIAGAGVLGLAVGFGAQTLVKDIITGIFIQLEGAMNTGDFVTVDGISGIAERITIRSVALRDLAGTYHLIPFSSVTTVSNFMRGFAYHVGEYGISYNDDIDEACEQLQLAFNELAEGEHCQSILEPITILGVSSLGDSSVNIRIRIKTLAGEQWTVGRAYNRLVKLYFDRAGIEIPYPHQTLYFGENKEGTAPPLKVRKMSHSKKKEEHMNEKIPPVPEVLQKQKSQDSTPNVSGQL